MLSRKQWGHGYYNGYLSGIEREKSKGKIIGFINGWKVAPHCWRHHVLKPIQIDNCHAEYAGYYSITLLGFTWFISN